MMADRQGLLGARSSESEGSGDTTEREAYEEDWYRSLRALAERQQRLAGPDDDLDEAEAVEAEAVEVADDQEVSEPTLEAVQLDEVDEVDAVDEVEAPTVQIETFTEDRIDGVDTEPLPVPPLEQSGPEPSETVDTSLEDSGVEPAELSFGLPQEFWREGIEGDTDLGAVDLQPSPSIPAVIGEWNQTGSSPAEPSAEEDDDGSAVEGSWEPSTEDVVEVAEAPTVEAVEVAEAPTVEVVEGPAEVVAAEEPSTEPVEPEPIEPEPIEPEPVLEPEAGVEPEAAVEPAPPSLSSTDPQERRAALEALSTGDLSEADTHRIEAVLLDPETDIRLLALGTLGRRPDRVSAEAIEQALQDPTDEVRAAAVDIAAERGSVAQVAALVSTRDWPLTQRAALELLPEVVAAEPLDDEALRRVLGAVGDLDPAPQQDELPALRRLALAVGSRQILDALSWPDVPRLGAIRLLAYDRSPAVLRELSTHSGDPIDEIRTFAAAAIAELAEAEAARERPPTVDRSVSTEEGSERIASLARALLDDDPTARHLALSGLAAMDRSAIAVWVRDAIASGDPSQLSLAASTAQMLRLVEGAADILDGAADLPVDARHALVDALASFLMPPEQLAGLLSHVREDARAEAIRMLWRVGGPPMLPHLRPYLDDPSAPVRLAVLDVFTESADLSASEVARVALETDVSATVRSRAVRMLAHLTVPPPPGTVVKAMGDPDPEVRATAIEALPDVDAADAMDALTSALSDTDDRVRLAAAKRLAARATDPSAVWDALRRAPDAERGEIVASFERVRSGSLTHIALERLRSPDLDERTLAVEVCGWGTSPGCVEGAIQALHDPAALVRRAATTSLGRLRDPAAANALGKALGDPDPEVRIGVVRALGVIDDEAVLGYLVSALNDPDARVRDVTSQVLTEWSSPAVAKRLAGVLAVPRLREAATDLLVRIGSPAVELLIDVLMQHNPAVVPTVGELLERIAQPEDLQARLEAVEPERRLRGVEALGAIGGPAAAEALLRSLADPDERIRGRAAQLLADLGDPGAREPLVGLLHDPIPAVVAAAQDALARLSGD